MLSGQRNMFLSSSIAIVMFGFSNNFNDHTLSWTVKIISMSIFLLSCYIGITASNEFMHYLNVYKSKLPKHVPVESWYRWGYVSYVYSIILLFIGMSYLFINPYTKRD
jgi:hypothetical protein